MPFLIQKFQWSYISSALVLVISAALSTVSYAAQLEEIIVTAQKREQNLQDVPASVTAISSEAFNTILSGGVSIKALAARAPSLNVNGNSGRFLPQFYIRGLGNPDFDVNANQPVSLVLDDVAIESTTLRSIPIFDVDQVEVLNGPQGTLFGRNTNAGIVKIDSVKPAFEKDGYVRASYGERGGRNVEFAIGGGLSDTVASRLSLSYTGQDDWIDNVANGSGDDLGGYDQYGARLQFLMRPSDNTSMLLKLHATSVESGTPVFYGNALTPGVKGTRPGFDEEVVTHDAESDQELDHFGASFKFEHEFDSFTLTSISSYDTVDSFSRADVDGAVVGTIGKLGQHAFGVATGDGFDDHYQVSQEVRFAFDTDNIFYQFGGYFFEEDYLVKTVDFANNNATTFTDQNTMSFAIFGQLEYRFSDALSVIGGIRFTEDEKELKTIDVAFPATIDADDNYVSWDLAVNYHVNEDIALFGRVAQGSRGPVTLGRFGFTSMAETETLTSFELGLKSDLFDSTARWHATAYIFDIEDLQITAVGQNDIANKLLNISNTRGYGFETDFEWLVTDDFRINTNLSYNNTEIRDSSLSAEACGSSPKCTPLDPVRSVDSGFFGPVTNVFINGNSLPLSPEWIFNVVLSYSYPISTGELYFNTDWNYKDEASIFLYESVEFVSEERWLGGLRVGYRNEDSGLDVAVVGRNITNEVTVFNGLGFLNLGAVVTDPRFFGVEIRYNLY